MLFKSLEDTFNLVIKKYDGNFLLNIDYKVLNNFILKNKYLLILINKSLDLLIQAK